MVRRFLTRLLMVILIAFCAYNWFEMQQLQRQLRDLQSRLAAKPLPSESLDWNEAQRRMQTLRTEIKGLRSQVDTLWQSTHPHNGHSAL